MKNDEILERIGAYRDGELDDATRAQVAEELKSCEASQAAYRELEAMDALVERAVLEPAAAADLTGFTDEVMARIAAETAPAPAREEEITGSLLDRLAAMLGLEGRGLVLAGAMAAAALAWFVWPSDSAILDVTPEAVRSADSAAQDGATPVETVAPRPRRGMELETASAGRNAASVQQVEVAHGRVVIDDNADDPDRPVVVWHIVGEEVDPEADASP